MLETSLPKPLESALKLKIESCYNRIAFSKDNLEKKLKKEKEKMSLIKRAQFQLLEKQFEEGGSFWLPRMVRAARFIIKLSRTQ